MTVKHLVVANWKMHHTIAQTNAFFDAFFALATSLPETIDVAIAPPFTALAQASVRLHGTRFALAAQNVHWDTQGAFTGEISAPMLCELDVAYAIVGHSERRIYFGETDETVRKRVGGALTAGIRPIVCVGESLTERQTGNAYSCVAKQTRAALADLPESEIANVTMAYEPGWAIGTGHNCDPEEANKTMGVIRESVPALASSRILYGGSVKPENIARYAVQANINGGLVGGASVDPTSFFDLLCNAVGGVDRT